MWHGDEDLLHQVVYNLVENAVKFTNTEGYISFNVSDSIDRIVVTIENSGSGIQSDELPLVFEKFYKTDKSRSQDKNGMGLGLYLVRTIIKLHGGDISVPEAEVQYRLHPGHRAGRRCRHLGAPQKGAPRPQG